MALVLKTAATKEPLSKQNVKDHLRIDISDDDVYISSLIEAVRFDFEERYNIALITQTWTLYLDSWPANEIVLPRWPLQSITSIKYTDSDDNQSTLSSGDYTVDAYNKPGRAVLKSTSSWPSDELADINGIEVEFVGGYGDDEADTPLPIRQAILIAIGKLYENREDLLVAQGVTVQELRIADLLMANYRSWNL